ncbi:flavin reductase family protein [Nakamurella leprariae]|uniref:Flavin reductase family protein n=1 Tax=Nakamurella leprariae TaxID=2803911 RepID=A0A938YED6_9ACTN|nr:flavin reductase family protein [Nakamurella leprariae]MBM9466649.1 flavin reductase family protein [Nakamurella leprariae]
MTDPQSPEPTAAQIVEDEAPFDSNHFRQVIGSFPSGITIVTAMLDGKPVGMTCQSFFSLSLDPPLIAFSPAVTSTSYPSIREAGKFAINVIADGQRDLAGQFARSGTDKWAGVDYELGAVGAPVIGGVAAVVECELETEYPAGDHFIVIGRVKAMSHELMHKPLLYFRSAYSYLADEA